MQKKHIAVQIFSFVKINPQINKMKKIKIHILFIASIFLLSGICQHTFATNKKGDKPNFIIIFTDDQGYQDLGCFGSPDIKTPHIDRMAEKGMRFTNFYAQTVCGPSRAALMTGCYPSRIAQWENKRTIHPGVHTKEIFIPEILKQQNYSTACFGKWDLARHSQTKFNPDLMPTKQGFDYFYGTPTSNDGRVRLMKNDQVIEENADMSTLSKKYTDEALSFIQKNKKSPFFIYLAHSMPHTIIDASSKFKGKSKRGLYGDVVEEIDWNVGRIFSELKKLELDKNTYVIFVSDNGPWYLDKHPKLSQYRDAGGSHGGSSTPLRGHKTSTWEGGLRVPCIMWGPNIPAGVSCHEIGSTMDLMPTITKIAGAKLPQQTTIDGEDIQTLMFGKKTHFDKDRIFFYYQAWNLQAVRKGKWKLHIPASKQEGWGIYSKDEDCIEFTKPVLFDLENDISESTDLASKYPEIVNDLLNELKSARNRIGDTKLRGKDARVFDSISDKTEN